MDMVPDAIGVNAEVSIDSYLVPSKPLAGSVLSPNVSQFRLESHTSSTLHAGLS